MWIDKCNGKIMLDLKRMHEFSKDFKQGYKVIHVGGTNGKGSVCNFISNILMKKYDVGLYTSPHLEKVNERICINGKEINDETIKKYEYLCKYNFTYFEALTAMALKYFEEKNVDYAVMEVGLGGRFDATNVVEPMLTIITNVSIEHTQWLGKSIEKIAMEKAGIIKNAPVVTSCRGKALNIIKRIAEKKGAKIYSIGKDFGWRRHGKKFFIEANGEYVVEPIMNAFYQGDNIAVAIKSMELIGIDRNDIINGIEETFIPARMERIGKFLVDGAHNPDGIKAFSKSIEEFDYDNVIIIFGVMKDKDVEKMVEFLPDAKIVIATSASNDRALQIEKIFEICNKKYDCLKSKNVGNAIKIAMKNSGKNDIIAIVGSLYLAGEARKIINNMLYKK